MISVALSPGSPISHFSPYNIEKLGIGAWERGRSVSVICVVDETYLDEGVHETRVPDLMLPGSRVDSLYP